MVRETWEGLRLRIVAQRSIQNAWPVPLVGPYLERKISELIPQTALAVAVERSLGRHPFASDFVLGRVQGRNGSAARSAAGAPDGLAAGRVSAAHVPGLIMAVAASGMVSCDLERVIARARPTWQDLLGVERQKLSDLLARELGEHADLASTRVWVAAECLKKAGVPPGSPLLIERARPEGWVLLRSGDLLIVTLSLSVRDFPEPLVPGVLVNHAHASLRVSARCRV
jgi:enediyne polyketide synthase